MNWKMALGKTMVWQIKDLTGQRYGKLHIVAATGERSKEGKVIWLCQCDCGNMRKVIGSNLTAGRIYMCRACSAAIQHECGKKVADYERLLNIYSHMRNRCCNPRCDNYVHYGGRGISLCDEWLNDFDRFYTWAMGNGYQKGLTIERIDVNGNYSPDNCRWIPPKEQLYNRRNTIYVYFKGKRVSLARMADDLNFDYRKIIGYLVRNVR